MGAAAFIMAEFLGTSYVNIIVAAAIPALLYFATIYFMVHLEAEKHGIGRIDPEGPPQGRGRCCGRLAPADRARRADRVPARTATRR